MAERPTLSEDQLTQIRSAKAQITQGALTIWNTRLDALVRAGDSSAALAHLISPVEHGDNCDCGCGGGDRAE